MQPRSHSHQLKASAEERTAEQAREIQQLREQLSRASMEEGPTLCLLSVPELNKALERPQPQWMSLTLSKEALLVQCARSARAVQLFGRLAVLETHTL